MSLTQETMKYRTQKWYGIIKACKSSGLSNKAWCEQNNINLKCYYYWQRKFKKSLCKHAASCEDSHAIVPLSTLGDEVAAKQQTVKEPAVIITLGNYKIEILPGSSEELIANALKAVKSIC